MEYQVVGDDITPEEMTEDHGWQSAGDRKAGVRLAGANHNGINSTTSDAPQGRNGGNNIKTRILCAGRMTQLPREDTKIVIRPRGGLSIVKAGSTVVADAILAATSICTEDLRGDTLCPNVQQNIMAKAPPSLPMDGQNFRGSRFRGPFQGTFPFPVPLQGPLQVPLQVYRGPAAAYQRVREQ
ncbi:hypothetical protein HPB50_029596 [Hyalomma asiaticum]|nr:hypothetical protein HPB50_029596 [Hyalomma asiaticum]